MPVGLLDVLMVMKIVRDHQANHFVRFLPPLIAVLFAVSGCSYTTAEGVKNSLDAPDPNVDQFNHCSAYGCSKVQQTYFNASEWEQITSLFSAQARDAADEREQLRAAVAMMEKIIGPKTGTDKDIAKSWLLTLMPGGQLDCIDESINTTTYLNLLNDAGFISYHDIGKIAIRGNNVSFMLLHNTATLIERDTGINYAIDSWFGANGTRPHIVHLDEWMKGWKPQS